MFLDTIIDGTKASDGGAFKVQTGSNLVVENSHVMNGRAYARGGVIFVITRSTVELVGVHFHNNSADKEGGGSSSFFFKL